MKKTLVTVLIVVGVLALLGMGLVSFGAGKYNTFIAMNQTVDKSWAQVENVLQRRNDLIPNLVTTVQGYAIH